MERGEQNQHHNATALGRYDFIVQGLFSMVSIGLGIFLILQHLWGFWLFKPLGMFCLFFPILLTVVYVRKQYKFEQERSVFLDKVLGASPAVIFVYNLNEEKVYILNGGFPTLGLSAKDLDKVKGDLFFQVSSPDGFRKIKSSLESTAADTEGKVHQTEWQLQARDRTFRTFRVSQLILSKSEEATLLIGYAEDITNEKSVQKYAALQDLGAGIAHEMANPLSIISNQVYLMSLNLDKENISKEYFKESVRRIDQSVKRMSRTIETLRILTRNNKEEEKLEVKGREIVSEVQGIWEKRLQSHGIELRTLIRSNTSFVIRESQVLSALLNLVSFCFHQIELEKPEDKWILIEIDSIAGCHEIAISSSSRWADAQSSGDSKESAALEYQQAFVEEIARSIIEADGGRFLRDRDSKQHRFVVQFPEEERASQAA